MGKSRTKVKKKLSISEIVLRFFFGFLIPFLIINGIIFYIYIQTPKITVIDTDSEDYEENKIKFSVDCKLPLNNVKTYFYDNEIPYTKLGNIYTVDITDNGIYQINVVAMNFSSNSYTFEVETLDNVPPTIDLNSAIITGNNLILAVQDDQSEINYDQVYATLSNGEKIKPVNTDQSSGTIQFQIDEGNKIIVHVEDINGNSSETSFTIN